MKCAACGGRSVRAGSFGALGSVCAFVRAGGGTDAAGGPRRHPRRRPTEARL